MICIRAKHFETLRAVDISVEGERICAIENVDCSAKELAGLPWVSPGFFDIQINGYNGIWFSSESLTSDSVVAVTQALIRQGITRYFPTLITASYEALHHGFSVLRQTFESCEEVTQTVAGFHLEGPYISPEDGPRGAHPRQHVRAADYDEFSRLQEASGNRIRLVTLAAEATNSTSFIRRCCADGVVVALGHTGATPAQINEAIEAGATLSTHFGNGAHAVLPRHPNYLWEQLASRQLWASVIADGWHVPASLLQCVLRCKTAANTILTCDVSGFAGCSPGTYQEGDVGVEVLEDGRIVVAGQRQFLAGSGATTGDCIAHMASACQISLDESVRMATANPARLFNEELPSLDVGQLATFAVFRINSEPSNGRPGSRFEPIRTFVHGNSYV